MKRKGTAFDRFYTSLGKGVARKDAQQLWRWTGSRQHLLGAQQFANEMPEPETLGDQAQKSGSPGVTIRVAPWPRKKTLPRPLDVNKHPGHRSFFEMLARDGPPVVMQEILKANFGSDDWRLAVLLVTANPCNKLENAELAAWLMRAVKEHNGDELRAFAKCLDALKNGDSPTKRAKALALYFASQRQLKYGKLPTKAEVRKYLEIAGIVLPERDSAGWKKLGRDLFSGPILSALPRGRAGSPKKPRK